MAPQLPTIEDIARLLTRAQATELPLNVNLFNFWTTTQRLMDWKEGEAEPAFFHLFNAVSAIPTLTEYSTVINKGNTLIGGLYLPMMEVVEIPGKFRPGDVFLDLPPAEFAGTMTCTVLELLFTLPDTSYQLDKIFNDSDALAKIIGADMAILNSLGGPGYANFNVIPSVDLDALRLISPLPPFSSFISALLTTWEGITDATAWHRGVSKYFLGSTRWRPRGGQTLQSSAQSWMDTYITSAFTNDLALSVLGNTRLRTMGNWYNVRDLIESIPKAKSPVEPVASQVEAALQNLYFTSSSRHNVWEAILSLPDKMDPKASDLDAIISSLVPGASGWGLFDRLISDLDELKKWFLPVSDGGAQGGFMDQLYPKFTSMGDEVGKMVDDAAADMKRILDDIIGRINKVIGAIQDAYDNILYIINQQPYWAKRSFTYLQGIPPVQKEWIYYHIDEVGLPGLTSSIPGVLKHAHEHGTTGIPAMTNVKNAMKDYKTLYDTATSRITAELRTMFIKIQNALTISTELGNQNKPEMGGSFLNILEADKLLVDRSAGVKWNVIPQLKVGDFLTPSIGV